MYTSRTGCLISLFPYGVRGGPFCLLNSRLCGHHMFAPLPRPLGFLLRSEHFWKGASPSFLFLFFKKAHASLDDTTSEKLSLLYLSSISEFLESRQTFVSFSVVQRTPRCFPICYYRPRVCSFSLMWLVSWWIDNHYYRMCFSFNVYILQIIWVVVCV